MALEMHFVQTRASQIYTLALFGSVCSWTAVFLHGRHGQAYITFAVEDNLHPASAFGFNGSLVPSSSTTDAGWPASRPYDSGSSMGGHSGCTRLRDPVSGRGCCDVDLLGAQCNATFRADVASSCVTLFSLGVFYFTSLQVRILFGPYTEEDGLVLDSARDGRFATRPQDNSATQFLGSDAVLLDS